VLADNWYLLLSVLETLHWSYTARKGQSGSYRGRNNRTVGANLSNPFVFRLNQQKKCTPFYEWIIILYNKTLELPGTVLIQIEMFKWAQMLLEMVCYVSLFNEQISSLKSVTDYLSDAAIQRRRQSNAVTLSGQVCPYFYDDFFKKPFDKLRHAKFLWIWPLLKASFHVYTFLLESLSNIVLDPSNKAVYGSNPLTIQHIINSKF